MLSNTLNGKKIWVIVGTRPEVIKQIPVYWELLKKYGKDKVALVGTGQHKELLQQSLTYFNTELDVNLDIMKPNQILTDSGGEILSKFSSLLAKYQPEWVVVQGDTTTSVFTALAAFYNKIKVAHNEAGLRTYDFENPFPEEANRRIISVIANLHFAPTYLAIQALLKENIAKEKIHLTGNSGIDSLFWVLDNSHPPPNLQLIYNKIDNLDLVFLTAHRRESEGEKILKWFEAVATFIENHHDLALVYPAHPNQIANIAIRRFFRQNPRIFIIEPLDYGSTCHLLNKSRFVITDSGGIQEESVALGVPVVVCRETTERMEAVHAGFTKLAGFDRKKIIKYMKWAYDKSQNISKYRNPIFGDGKSAKYIADKISLTL